jgi:hypothetical protein
MMRWRHSWRAMVAAAETSRPISAATEFTSRVNPP